MSDKDSRSDLTYGPKLPDEELPDSSSRSWKKEYLKRAAGITGATVVLYTGYELGVNAGRMEVDEFLDSLQPSVDEVLEGAADTGADAAITYGPEAASYAVELSNSFL